MIQCMDVYMKGKWNRFIYQKIYISNFRFIPSILGKYLFEDMDIKDVGRNPLLLISLF